MNTNNHQSCTSCGVCRAWPESGLCGTCGFHEKHPTHLAAVGLKVVAANAP